MRVAASAAVSALVAGVLTGCMFVTPQQTARSYTPSDGVNTTIGDVRVRNVFLLSENGTDASMLGALSNSGDADRTVTLQYRTATGDETTQVTVPAGGLLSLRTDPAAQVETSVPTEAQAVVLEGLRAPVGGLFSVGFSVSGADPVTLRVPVLNGSLVEYEAYLPTPTPSEPLDDPTADPAETPAPGEAGDPAETPEPADPAEPSEPPAG